MWKEGQISPWRPFLEQGRGQLPQEPGSHPLIPEALLGCKYYGVEGMGVSLDAGATLP